MTQQAEALAAEVKRLVNAYAAACVEFEVATVADAVARELRAEMLGAEKKLDAAIAALSSQPPRELPDFEEAFQLVYEAYARPADTFEDHYSWAVWQHGKVIKAFSLMQKVRISLTATAGSTP